MGTRDPPAKDATVHGRVCSASHESLSFDPDLPLCSQITSAGAFWKDQQCMPRGLYPSAVYSIEATPIQR